MKRVALLAILISLLGNSVFAKKHHGRRKNPALLKPAELRGSTEQRIRQNEKAINLGIGQIATEGELKKLAAEDRLIELKNGAHYFISRNLTKRKQKLAGGIKLGKKISTAEIVVE